MNKRNARVLLTLWVSFLAVMSHRASAALPLDAINEMKDAASEKVRIEVTSVKRTEKEEAGAFLFYYRVRATVVAVDRSKAGLEVGDEIEIRYSMPNLEKTPAAGDWPSPVEEGKEYFGYLTPRNAEKKRYELAAASGSFEPTVPEE